MAAPGLPDINSLVAVLSRGLEEPGSVDSGEGLSGNPGLWLFSNRYETISIFLNNWYRHISEYQLNIRLLIGKSGNIVYTRVPPWRIMAPLKAEDFFIG